MKVLVERHKPIEKKFQIDCPYCGSTLEYTCADLIKEYYDSFIHCPVCRKLIRHDENFEVKFEVKMNYTDEDLKNGLILNGSEKGREYGLTLDRFTNDSYLWLEGNTLWISLVISRREGCGYVRNIIDIAKSKGHTIMCMPVSSRMVDILEKNGFIQQGEYYIWETN